MNRFYLPNLQSIKIENYSLYPNGLSFEYEFINGINLIIGGNGVGKTTFLNLIKYGIIGLYKKGVEVKQRDKKKIEKRVNLPYQFFRNRADAAFPDNNKAEVTISFKLNSTNFKVTRSLDVPTLKKVIVNENGFESELIGEIVSQAKYDDFLRFQPTKTEGTLQKVYEDKVGESSGLIYFDSLIFLVNEVLFFGENRKTIIWERDSSEESSVQSKLSSKYFNDPELDNERSEAERNAKYHDSVSRHYSEDIRAINGVIRKITESDKNEGDFKNIMSQIELAKAQVQQMTFRLDENDRQMRQTEIMLNETYAKHNNLSQLIDECEGKKRIEEEVFFKAQWQKLHLKYRDFLKYIKDESDCPLCNQQMISSVRQHIILHEENCMLCGNTITSTTESNDKIATINVELNKLLTRRIAAEKEIVQLETTTKRLDQEFNKLRIESNQSQIKQRRLEFALQKQQTDDNGENNLEFTVMKARIDELEQKRVEHAGLSKTFRKKVDVIDAKIDQQLLNIRSELSDAFSQYASQFLGVPCELVYEDFGEGLNKRYLPNIDGTVRKYEEELSESQRFFIDQSFRMSLLNYFYSTPTFFMCETPDSSLDISYEQNAAKIFLKFIEKPNAIIITSNLNNSEFLDYMIEHAPQINYINLLRIGRQSKIQSTSEQLIKASSKIETQINAKRH